MLQTFIGVATLLILLVSLATNLYALWRMVKLTAEAREARTLARESARRAEDAATLAAAHASDAAAAIAIQGVDIKTLKKNTDGIQKALLASTKKASRLQGRAEVVDENENESARELSISAINRPKGPPDKRKRT